MKKELIRQQGVRVKELKYKIIAALNARDKAFLEGRHAEALDTLKLLQSIDVVTFKDKNA